MNLIAGAGVLVIQFVTYYTRALQILRWMVGTLDVVPKADPRVEPCGALDELSSVVGLARSICRSERVREATKAIQRELFAASASLAPAPSRGKKEPGVDARLRDASHEGPRWSRAW